MYEYKFVKIELEITLWQGLKPQFSYHEVIEEHAAQGWRLVQVFAPSVKGFGRAGYFEVILEREKSL